MNKSWHLQADADTTCEGKMTKESDVKIQSSNTNTGHKRKSYVRKWMDRKMRRVAEGGLLGGLGSTLLALPALAQATIEDLYAFQFAETIPGVRSVKPLGNGDVLLKMADGRKIIVASENVQVLDSGAIMIAENAVAEIAQFSLIAETGGAAASGGIGGIGAAALGGLGLAGAAAAAGGGGGGDGDDTPPPAPTYRHLNLAGAQSNALNSATLNLSAPEGAETVEVSIGSSTTVAVLNDDGTWSASFTPVQASALPQGVNDVVIRNLDSEGEELAVETVIFDVDTVPPTLSISGYSDGTVLNAREQTTDLVVTGTTNAENGQTVIVTINGQSYTGSVQGGQWSVAVPSDDLTALPDGATIAVTANVTDEAGNPAAQASSSFGTDFTAPSITLNPISGGSIELIDLNNDLTLGGTTTAADGQVVTINFDGRTYTTTASGGQWSATVPSQDLSGLTTGTPVAVSAVVSDPAGNVSVPTNALVPVDLTGPSLTIAPLSTGATLNAIEGGTDLVITGTTDRVEDGQIVSVELDGQTYTTAVSGSSWSVTIPTADLLTLADGGSFTLTADVSDTDGLSASQASVPLGKDVTAPTLSIDSFSSGAVMNAVEQGTDLSITGSTNAEDGQTISVVANGQTYTATTVGGSWTATVPAADLSSLSDGATIAVSADVTDAAGNPAVQATSSFQTDFTAPAITITGLSDGAVMTASEQTTDLTVAGTSDAQDGATVTVAITRPDNTVDATGTTTVSGGTWTYIASATDLAGLQDGLTYSVTATIADDVGNESTDATSFATDFTAPTITLNALPGGPVLDISERNSDLTVSGATNAEDGQSVSVTLDGQTYNGTVSGGNWSATIPTADLIALSDGTGFFISATVSDAAGNTSLPTSLPLTTDFRPILNLNTIGSNKAIDLSDATASGVVVSGTSIGLSVGQSVDVTLNTLSVGTAVVATDGTWSLAVSASDFSGVEAGDTLNFQAQANVSGGTDPLPASDQVKAHDPAAYTIVEAGRSGSVVTFEIYADPDRDISSGLAITADLGFDPSVVTFDLGSDNENSDFDLFLANPNGPAEVSFGGAATVFTDLTQPLVTFTMTVQDPGRPIQLSLTTPDGGPTDFLLGTGGNDTLVSTDVDNVVRGQSGDDTIDVSSSGRDVIVFEADPSDNGTDIVTGFTLGPAADVSDALMFSGLNTETLRGNGTGMETLNIGEAIGLHTGFVGLATQLSDLSKGTIETAAESLTGVQAGDEIYVLATDGEDSTLVKVDYTAPGSASVETIAEFSGFSDLSSLSSENILHTDPTGASA
ncbi:hypothetical protein RUESEDTHA_03797 [Ruegeria sp. THAF57]|nr:hypothetical protein RUESEDTHA_03797 [Ruegeria sp. THAF57]